MHEEDKVLDEVLGPILVKKDIISSICANQNILDIGHDSSGANSNNQREASFTATSINEPQSLVKIKTEMMSSDDDEDLNQTNNIEFSKLKSFNNSLHEVDKVLDEVLRPIWHKEDIILDAVLRPRNCTNQMNNQLKKTVAEQNILDISGGANSNSQMETESLVKIKNEILSSDDDEDMNHTNNIEFSRQNSFDISENKAEIDSCDDYHQNFIQCTEVKSEPIDTSDSLINGEFEPKESLESETMYCLPDEEKCKVKAKANVFACNKCDMNFMTARSLGQHKRIHNDSTILALDVDRIVRQKIQSRMRSKRYRDRLKQLRVNLQL